MDSILQRDKCCAWCGTTYNLHKHHVFPGTGLRKISDKNGFWVWLCAEHHNMGTHCIHNDPKLMKKLKAFCQQVYERKHTREEFMALIGRNYLEGVA